MLLIYDCPSTGSVNIDCEPPPQNRYALYISLQSPNSDTEQLTVNSQLGYHMYKYSSLATVDQVYVIT